MCPPSSWPTGRRFSAVANRPTHAARPTGCSSTSVACAFGWRIAVINFKAQRHAENDVRASDPAPNDGMTCERVALHKPARNGEQKSDQRAGSANVKQCAGRANRRTEQDERTKRPDQSGSGNKKRIGGLDMMMATGEIMAKLVSQQNRQQSDANGSPERSREG